jgi:ATP synthase delta (OSCP) subunit
MLIAVHGTTADNWSCGQRLPTLECGPAQVQKLAQESVDFGRFIKDPTISREQKAAALESISSEMKLSELTSRFIGALPLSVQCACYNPHIRTAVPLHICPSLLVTAIRWSLIDSTAHLCSHAWYLNRSPLDTLAS